MFLDAFSGSSPNAGLPVLEVIERGRPQPGRPSLVFLHGAFAGAWCFEEYYLDYFAALGFHAIAFSLRGHGRSDGRDALNRASLQDYVVDLRRCVEAQPEAPVVIGHSMGGLVTQMALSEGLALRAAILLAPVPPSGLVPSAAQMAVSDPRLFWQTLVFQSLGSEWIEAEYAQRALFVDPLDPETVARYTARMQPESTRALLEMSAPRWLDAARVAQTPLAVFSAEQDAIIPAWTVAQVSALYGVETVRIPAVGHAMMLDREWERSAQAIVAWLETAGLYQR